MSDIKSKHFTISSIGRYIDVFLLLFLIVFTVDKVVLKPVAIVFAIIYLRNQLSFKDILKAPPFYLLLLVPEVFKFSFLNTNFSFGHFITFGIGIAYWLMAALAFIVIRSRIELNSTEKTNRTLTIYFLLNAVISLAQLAMVMLQAGSFNPYGLEVAQYGNSTGDFIKGIMLAPCYINMFINTLFVFYFLYHNKYRFAFLAAALACLTTSNFANFIFLIMLISALFYIKQTKARLTIIGIIAFFALFYVFVSSGNFDYLKKTQQDITKTQQEVINPSSSPSHDEEGKTQAPVVKESDKKETMALISLKADYLRERLKSMDVRGCNLAKEYPYLFVPDSTLTNTPYLPLNANYGKGISVAETYNYLITEPKRLLFGAGIGNFSSQLAERMSGIREEKGSRLFKALPQYMSCEYMAHHYQILSVIYSLPSEYHSIRHLPHSSLNQIFGEYGLVGFLLFIFFYVLFFLKKPKAISYTAPMLIMICGYMLFDYLFEYLSAIVFFEMFYLLNKKQKAESSNTA